MNRRDFVELCACSGIALAVSNSLGRLVIAQKKTSGPEKISKSNEEWKRILSSEQYYITRQAGTEAPYSSPLLEIHDKGTFNCVCCDLPLFSSDTKFDSQTGWPSFWAPISKRNVQEKVDKSLAEVRTEVLCARCDAHLGHVFEDGPPPTGLRYCMNGVALKFSRKA
ncbi:MAG TPA: peptide-methionine (R)-S-oxide reductase MsrB [Pyrinomonadaceae bacterium]